MQSYRYYKIRVCDKDSIPLWNFEGHFGNSPNAKKWIPQIPGNLFGKFPSYPFWKFLQLSSHFWNFQNLKSIHPQIPTDSYRNFGDFGNFPNFWESVKFLKYLGIWGISQISIFFRSIIAVLGVSGFGSFFFWFLIKVAKFQNCIKFTFITLCNIFILKNKNDKVLDSFWFVFRQYILSGPKFGILQEKQPFIIQNFAFLHQAKFWP